METKPSSWCLPSPQWASERILPLPRWRNNLEINLNKKSRKHPKGRESTNSRNPCLSPMNSSWNYSRRPYIMRIFIRRINIKATAVFTMLMIKQAIINPFRICTWRPPTQRSRPTQSPKTGNHTNHCLWTPIPPPPTSQSLFQSRSLQNTHSLSKYAWKSLRALRRSE